MKRIKSAIVCGTLATLAVLPTMSSAQERWMDLGGGWTAYAAPSWRIREYAEGQRRGMTGYRAGQMGLGAVSWILARWVPVLTKINPYTAAVSLVTGLPWASTWRATWCTYRGSWTIYYHWNMIPVWADPW